jgi:hypothetical protein
LLDVINGSINSIILFPASALALRLLYPSILYSTYVPFISTITMAAQAALIADTIIGMKRALRKENECKFSCSIPLRLFIALF